MALRVRSGSNLTLGVALQNRDTLAPIPDAPVFLDLLVQAAAAPQQVAGAQTDASGQATFRVVVPTTPGTYRYRARHPGIAGVTRPDTSREVPIEAVAL